MQCPEPVMESKLTQWQITPFENMHAPHLINEWMGKRYLTISRSRDGGSECCKVLICAYSVQKY